MHINTDVNFDSIKSAESVAELNRALNLPAYHSSTVYANVESYVGRLVAKAAQKLGADHIVVSHYSRYSVGVVDIVNSSATGIAYQSMIPLDHTKFPQLA